jgi:hypothetical protein
VKAALRAKVPTAEKTADMFVPTSFDSHIHSTPLGLSCEADIGSGRAWLHNFDIARHHGDVPDASSRRAGLLHSFAAARDVLAIRAATTRLTSWSI